MKVIGLITEYNPFHFGHKHHLEYSRKNLDATHTIGIISGSFVQRGQPSMVDKWTKSQMAIDNGVDLVIELPFVYAVESAELFALGALKILDSLNLVDYISFGSEVGNIEVLDKIADIVIKEPKVFKDTLTAHLNKGLSFPASRSKAISKSYREYYHSDDSPIENILKQSNNILGIEYLKAIKTLNSTIRPYTLKRLGQAYMDKDIKNNIASATGIRNASFKHGIDSIKKLLPQDSYIHLLNFYKKYGTFNSLEKYYNVINYLLISKPKEYLKEIMDMEDGLENRIVRVNENTNSIYDLIEQVSTKRYPRTRIQRILIHLLLGLDKKTIDEIYAKPNKYIRVLASNKKGLELLKYLKNNRDIHIISKYSDYKYLNDPDINLILEYEEKATDIFFFGINSNEFNMDFLNSPYIK